MLDGMLKYKFFLVCGLQNFWVNPQEERLLMWSVFRFFTL